jgi:hypothetical protein
VTILRPTFLLVASLATWSLVMLPSAAAVRRRHRPTQRSRTHALLRSTPLIDGHNDPALESGGPRIIRSTSRRYDLRRPPSTPTSRGFSRGR